MEEIPSQRFAKVVSILFCLGAVFVTYWLRAVVQFVVLTFQSEQEFLQIISKWESCAS